ncbi:ATP-binding protein [archaeon]|nr:ATP-binding protein [archaeon]
MIVMINRDTWVRIIKDFHEFRMPDMVTRDIDIHEPPIKRAVCIIGPRRSGKTYFIFQTIKKLLDSGIKKERMLYVNFENDMLLGCNLQDMRNMLDIFFEIYADNRNDKIYLFLDEIQNVYGWEKFVRTVIDNEKAQVYITGSSSKLLSKEISTSLRGRTITYNMYTFNFAEFLEAKKVKLGKYFSSSQKSIILNNLSEYMKGGYPEVAFFPEEREKILKEILDVTIYRDVMERFKIKNLKVLRLLLKGLVSSNYFSVHRFYNYMKSLGIKISKKTLYNYIEYFSDAMILYMLRKYSNSYKELEQTTPKVYFVDNGLVSSQETQDKGRLMENIVFTELARRSYIPNENLFYFLSNNKEVDFVIRRGKKITQLLQVCYRVDDTDTKDREIGALLKAGKELKCNNMSVLTWDYEATETHKNKKIKFYPLWKWLLDL